METTPPITALFVSIAGALEAGGGGVQWCSREYHATFKAAGINLHDFSFAPDRSLRARLLRRWRPRPFDIFDYPGLAIRVLSAARQAKAKFLLLNNTAACALAPALRGLDPSVRLIFLSHGAEITDVVNNLLLAPGSLPRHHQDPAWIGRLLTAELVQRAALDAAIVISMPDRETERWLGTKRQLYLPRQVLLLPLQPARVLGRIGCVATLDHGPNRHGLELLAAALSRYPKIELRIVGGPEPAGRDLASRHPSIHYCGRLDEPALETEAASWRAFVNPIFCPARGASTKVATALGWGLPVLTTPDGARGYMWSENALPLAASPEELARLAHTVACDSDHERWDQAAREVAQLAPSLAASAAVLTDFLASLSD